MEVRGVSDLWTAAKQVGELLGVAYQKPKKSKAKTTGKMTPAALERSIHNLLEEPEAEWARKLLKERNIWDPAILASMGVGFLDGAISFAQWYPNGELRERWRSWTPLAKIKYRWSKLGAGGPTGVWSVDTDLPKNASILLCEGEGDVLTARINLRLQGRDEPIYAYTWTGGAGSPLAASLLPPEWSGRKVYVCYDNDVWQGVDVSKATAPNTKKLRELEGRRTNMLKGVCAKLEAFKCDVRILHVDISPIDHFGADLRDWVKAGKAFDELPECKLADVLEKTPDPIDVSHAEAFGKAGEYIRFNGSVAVINNHNLVVPVFSKIDCPMGSKNCCRDCPVTRLYTDQDIEWVDHREHLLNALISKDFEYYVVNKMLCRPRSCNECSIKHQETTIGSWWEATPGDDANENEASVSAIVVVSSEPPSLSGNVQISGHAHYTKNGSVGILADKLEMLDKPEVDIAKHHQELLSMTPWDTDDVKVLEDYFNKMASDYSNNVTKIYGRPEFHIGTSLVAHSALWYNLDGHRYRGWLDACFFGDTRQGKSETVKRLFEYWGVGQTFTCMENFSRAGLTVGGADNGSRMQPGLFPKNHRKMLFLDEFHHMASGPADKNVMVHLQSARDEGKVSALKVYGDLKLPAAVRLITAGNWANRSRRTYQYICQHLQAFYGVPESLSRMDFAWSVSDSAIMIPEDVEHEWTPEIARALIMRAWAMEPHQIHIDKDALALAKQLAKEWDTIYASEDLALHTGIEKYHCLIRIAIAAANKAYSHPKGVPADCRVRKVHVQFAINWILACWQNLQYDEFSQRRISARTVTQPFQVERNYTVSLALSDPDHGAVVLSRLTEACSLRSLQGLIIGCGEIEEPRHFSRWLATQIRCSAIVETSKNQFHIEYLPTAGALKILRRLIYMARDDPDAYSDRYRKLSVWNESPESKTMLPGIAANPDLDPLDEDEEKFFDDCPF